MLRALVRQAMPYLPLALRRALRERADMRRRKQQAVLSQRPAPASDEIVRRIGELRLERDVMIHASLGNLGKLDQPFPLLVSRVLAAMDLSRQTVLVPALPFQSSMEEYLAGTRVFDVRRARNAMGAFSMCVGRRPDAVRSLHPSHSVIAIGRDRMAYTAEHHFSEAPFDARSPYARLVRERGQILLIGVGLNTVTAMHTYEDMLGASLPIRVYRCERMPFTLIDAAGNEHRAMAACHDPHVSARRQSERARPWLVQAGAMRTHRLGEAELSVIDARLMARTLLERLALGQSIYGPLPVEPHQAIAITKAIEELDLVP